MNRERMVTEAVGLQLHTTRLVLRRFEASDTEEAVAQQRDPRIRRWVRAIEPLEVVRAKVARFGDPWHGEDGEWLAIVVSRREEPGMIGLFAVRIESAADGIVEIGYTMRVDVQRRGYALEAARHLLAWLLDEVGVRKVVARCASPNVASYRLLEKLGMRREGVLREHCVLDGTLCDELLYGLLARERADPQAGA
ncbi:MAG: GNAT family protein [Planctomycetota bacterium]